MHLVLEQSAKFTAAGVALGMAGGLVLSHSLRSLLFGVGITDPVTYVAAAGMMGMVVLAACVIPVYRAVSVDLMQTLRAE
jgi:hypothetical protein